MRTVTHGDVVAVSCAVRDLPAGERRAAVLRILHCAHAADLFRKKFRRNHPLWGTGSLGSVVLRIGPPSPEPFLSDRQYLEAMFAVIDALLEWRQRIT